MARPDGNSRDQSWIHDQVHDLLTHAELDDSRREGVVSDLSRHGQKSMGKVDSYAPECNLGCDVVLVGVGAKHVRPGRSANRLEDAESSRVSVLKDDVDTTGQLRERLLLSGAYVVPVADVRGHDLRPGVHTVYAVLEREKALTHRRQFGAPDQTESVGACHGAGDHAGEIGGLREAKHHSAHVPAARVPRRHDVLCRWIGGRYGARGVLKLEAVAENQIKVLVPILAEVLLELGRRLSLNVANLSAEGVAYPKQTLVGASIPRLVRNRSRGK